MMMTWNRRVALLGLVISFLTQSVSVQAQMLPAGDPLVNYGRVLQLSGLTSGTSFMVRPVSTPLAFDTLCTCAIHPWQPVISRYVNEDASTTAGTLRYWLFYPDIQTYWNSERPVGMNDGAVWQGKGSTIAVSTGIALERGIFSLAFRPTVIYTQNQAFTPWPRLPLSNRSSFSHPTRTNIDLPQRFGPDAFTALDLGQSYARVDFRGLAAGLSNESLWWGPARHNAIVMSNNAPGFPHAFLGTARPLPIGVGEVEGRWVWGALSESDYFDEDDSNNRRFLTALALALQPDFTPGLYLGLASSLMLHPEVNRHVIRDYLGILSLPFHRSERWPQGKADRMFSVSARYVPPGAGFEAYFEWGRGDTLESVRNFLTQPDHGRGYTLGLQKLFTLSPRVYLTVSGEHTRLEATRDLYSRTVLGGQTYFYAHDGIPQGYTQRGQVIGAGIGPGATQHRIDLDLYFPRGGAGLYGYRFVHDNDRFYREPLPHRPHLQHEVEYGGGIEATLFLAGFEIRTSYAVSNLLNQFWIRDNDQTNTNITFSLRRPLSARH